MQGRSELNRKPTPQRILKNLTKTAGLVGLGLALATVSAQTVINNNGSNNTTNVIVQRAPVVIIERGQQARQISPAATARPPPPSFPYQQRDLLPYMSPRCAQLFEAQLTSGARRTSYSAAVEVREEFRLHCQDAASEAQKALYQDKLKSYNLRQETASVDRLAAQQSKTSREQCDELLRILAAKRKRVPAMTDGERADHERSEANYQTRCAGA
jgi:hypothetical protein